MESSFREPLRRPVAYQWRRMLGGNLAAASDMYASSPLVADIMLLRDGKIAKPLTGPDKADAYAIVEIPLTGSGPEVIVDIFPRES